MSANLCSDLHISVLADAVIRYLPSDQVIRYIMACGLGDAHNKTLPTVVGSCLFNANIASLKARHGELEDDIEDSYVYVESPKIYSYVVSVIFTLSSHFT